MSRKSFVAADFLRKWAEKVCGGRFLKEMSRKSLWRAIPQGNEPKKFVAGGPCFYHQKRGLLFTDRKTCPPHL